MQFAFLLYDDESFEKLSEAQQMAVFGEHQAFTEALKAAGAHIGGEPLTASATAKTLRQGGRVEDGPYADTKEQLGGFYLIEAPDMDAALGWARKCPAAKTGHIEVRAVPSFGG